MSADLSGHDVSSWPWLWANRWRAFGLSGLAGAVAATGQAPLGWAGLAFVALIALCAVGAAPAPSWRKAALQGWLAGLGYFSVALNWIVEPFLVEPELYGWLAPFGLLGLAGGLALFWSLAFVLASLAGGGALRLALALALVELARGTVLTGFPWALPGYIWVDTIFAQWAALVGPYGLTALTLFMVALPVWLWGRSDVSLPALKIGRIFSLTVGIGVVLWYGAVTLAAREPIAIADAPVIRLVQPNAPQDQKWDPEMIPIFFNRMVDFSAAAPKPDLILWPESSVPVLLEEGAETLGYISDRAGGVPMVLGLQRSEGEDFYNSAAFLDVAGQVGQVYDKHHLVPFGEYMPFPKFWQNLGITGLAARVETGYSAGPGPELLDLGFGTALPLICYEAVFPQYARHTAAPYAMRPDFLLQLTNDAWFGALTGPYQHLAQARMRAIETGLPMVRVANTGVSAMIDAHGKITDALALNTAGFLDTPLPAVLPPTLYARSGDLPVTMLLFFLALAAFWPVWRARD